MVHIFKSEKQVAIQLALLCILGIAEVYSENDVGACADQLNSIKSTKQFQQFAEQFRIHEHNKISNVPCMQKIDSINQLDELINETSMTDVCHPNHIDLIVQYHEKYVQKTNNSMPDCTEKFFRRYAEAVSLTCNQNLYANLFEADSELGGRHNVESCKIPNDDYKPPMPQEIMGEVMDLVESVQRPDQIELISSLPKSANLAIVGLLPIDDREEIKVEIRQCRILASYYESIIKSIARLAQIGYGWEFDTIRFYDTEHRDRVYAKSISPAAEDMLQFWLGIVQVCDSLLNLHVEFVPREEKKVILVAADEINAKNHALNPSLVNTFERNNEDFQVVFEDLFDGSLSVGAKPMSNQLHNNSESSLQLSPMLKDYVIKFAKNNGIPIEDQRRERHRITRDTYHIDEQKIDADSSQALSNRDKVVALMAAAALVPLLPESILFCAIVGAYPAYKMLTVQV